jgi:hypothetical protein
MLRIGNARFGTSQGSRNRGSTTAPTPISALGEQTQCRFRWRVHLALDYARAMITCRHCSGIALAVQGRKFSPDDADVLRCVNSNPYGVSFRLDHGQRDLMSDANLLTWFP